MTSKVHERANQSPDRTRSPEIGGSGGGHTPGPWDCEMRAPAGVKWDAIIRSAKNRDPICTVFMAGYMEKAADANARLIAAAPELGDVAGSITISESEDNSDVQNWVVLTIDAIEICRVDFCSAAAGALLEFDSRRRAALARATGAAS